MGSSAGSPAIEPELLARFKAALDRLNPEGGRIGLAVSGGPDSMAMLLLAQEVMPGAFEVATVDHGLRPEAREECALVAAACAERGVPCAVLSVEVGEGNVQAEAREARYFALDSWAQKRMLDAVATAHHADDQAETLLMRLNRGSGVGGLSGVREHVHMIGCEYPVIRPLLAFRRSELLGLVERAQVAFAQDSSNSNVAYDRVRIRRALEGADWLDIPALARSAAHLAAADEALEVATNRAMRDQVSRDGDVITCVAGLDREIAFRVVRRIIGRLGGAARGGDVLRMIEALERGEQSNVGGVLASFQGEWGKAESPRWYFRREPPRRDKRKTG